MWHEYNGAHNGKLINISYDGNSLAADENVPVLVGSNWYSSKRQMKGHVLLFLFFCSTCWVSPHSTAFGEDDFPQNKYQSFLQYPHISFRGKFKANVATGNNVPSNYDSEEFFDFDKFGNRYGGKNQWNPDGTNEFSLFGCHVTSACHLDGKCTDSSDEDSVCNSEVIDAGIGSIAKIVDIDTTFQDVPEIWSLKVRVEGFFEGEMDATPLADYWSRGGTASDSATGGAYRSCLRNINWLVDADSSTAIKQMRAIMRNIGSDRLSISFSLDKFSVFGEKEFSMGRIIGTIGVLGPLAPTVNVWGRSLAPLHRLHGNGKKPRKEYTYTNDVQFVIDKKLRRLYMNFGNSMMTDKNGDPRPFPKGTKIGYFKKAQSYGIFLKPRGSCAKSAVVIGDFSKFNLTEIMLNFGGIISISVSSEQVKDLDNIPLTVFQVRGPFCVPIMQEYRDGILVQAYKNMVFRLEPNQPILFEVFVTKFGKPSQNTTVTIRPYNKLFQLNMGNNENASFVTMKFATNNSGLVTLNIPTQSSNFKRKGLDGNMEGYYYYVYPSAMSKDNNRLTKYSMAFAHVYSRQSYPEEITWVDHVYPIFKQYANLFPVMRSRTFDMGNYFDVVAHKDIMRISLSLPISHPSYMPATRDLSKVKQQMIIKWLNQENPPFGDVSKLISKHYLLDLLQRALEVTHASMPPFLNAMWSIKGRYNKKVSLILNTLIRQEVNKIGIIAAVIKALGGNPKFIHKEFVPSYPSRLHGGLRKDILLPLQRLSHELLRNHLLELKRPDIDYSGIWFRNTVFKHLVVNRHTRCRSKHSWRSSKCRYFWFSSKHRSNLFKNKVKAKCKLSLKILLAESLPKSGPARNKSAYIDPQDRHYFNYHSSIDKFYNHILLVLSHITKCGSNNTIFVDQKGPKKLFIPQESVFGHVPRVYDYFSAVDAIRQMLRITNELDENFSSQYHLLLAIVKETTSNRVLRPENKLPRSVFNEAEELVEEFKAKRQFLPPVELDILKHGIWPVIDNPKVDLYPKGHTRDTAVVFNDVYTFFLVYSEKIFQTSYPTNRKRYLASVRELARAMGILSRRLMEKPIHKRGNKHVGPNAAPTFEIDFMIARSKFLLQTKYLKLFKKHNWDTGLYIRTRKDYVLRERQGEKEDESSNDFMDGDAEDKGDWNSYQSTGSPDYDVFRPLGENPFLSITAIYDHWYRI